MSPSFVQTNRPFAVGTPLGPDALLLERFEGEEGVSQPFRFALEMLSANPAVDAESLLGQPAFITVALQDGGERVIHGRVSRFAQLGAQEGMATYTAELVPWLWFLSLARDCRIFQKRSVPEIVEQVFTRLGYTDFEMRLGGTYASRTYCVQYRETHLDFVSRLLEDEGIFYFFEHTAERHTLVLADDPGAVQPAWGMASAEMAQPGAGRQEDVVLDLRREHAVQTAKVTLTSYDWMKPSHELLSTVGENGTAAPVMHEAHDYPHDFLELAEGDRYARLHLEESEARRQVIRGTSTCRAFQSGARFALERHYRSDLNQPYHILRVRHEGKNGSYFGGDADVAEYENAFEAMPAAVPFRPPRVTPRPRVRGTQSALVVGPAGEEIWTDKHGRVTLHFYWDRESKRDEHSSCPVRVSTAWAGKGWGQFSVPRIGQEVLVEYMDGNPDWPVVVGRVYNAEQGPPCDPGGAGGVKSGMRSKTHKGEGGNWMEMDDTAKKEKIDIHAQYDMVTTVGHDDTQTVKNDRTITIAEGKLSQDVVAGTATYHVKGAVVESFEATQATIVKSDIAIVSQTGGIAIAADALHVYIKGTTSIQLHVGASMIWMDSGGQISIEGVNVSIKGSTNVTIKGGTVHSEAESQHQTKGAIVLSEGSATNTVKGGMVMLNP